MSEWIDDVARGPFPSAKCYDEGDNMIASLWEAVDGVSWLIVTTDHCTISGFILAGRIDDGKAKVAEVSQKWETLL